MPCPVLAAQARFPGLVLTSQDFFGYLALGRSTSGLKKER